MNCKSISKNLYKIVNFQFTQTILIAIVTIGGVWYTQSTEREKWELQRKEEKEFWLYDIKLKQLESDIIYYERMVQYGRGLPYYLFTGNWEVEFFNEFYMKLSNTQQLYLENLENKTKKEKDEIMSKIAFELRHKLDSLKNSREFFIKKINNMIVQ